MILKEKAIRIAKRILAQRVEEIGKMVEHLNPEDNDFTSCMESDPFFAEFGGLVEEEDNSMIVDSNDADETKNEKECIIEHGK